MQSMTGFAEGKKEAISITIKSVNHRALDVEFSGDALPIESEEFLRNFCKQNLFRGKVRIVFNWQRETQKNKRLLNESAIDDYLKLQTQLAAKLPNLREFSAYELLHLDGVLQDVGELQNNFAVDIQNLFSEIFAQFKISRKTEGAQLAAFLTEKALAIDNVLNFLNENLPALNALWQEKMRKRFKEFSTAELPEERLVQEFTVQLLKTDVAEELSRLKAHIENLKTIIQSPAPHGKRLDFLMQELMREANTLASKAISNEVTSAAMQLKVLIEQMREQVQNIE